MYTFVYDYRSRRVERGRQKTSTGDPFDNIASGTDKVVFSGGTSVRELDGATVSVNYIRGSDWGGGVGGILYTLKGTAISTMHYNARGDVTMRCNANQSETYTGDYTAFGERVNEGGTNPDRQKSNTKDEDVVGYANEGFRFRDVENGMFISRDPLGFVDGPNMYAYVNQNPWSSFDPEGLKTKEQHESIRAKLDERRAALQDRLDGATALGDKSKQGLADKINGLTETINAETTAINSIESTAKYMRAQADKLAWFGVGKKERMYKDAENLDDESDMYKGWAASAAMANYQAEVGAVVLLSGAGKLVGGVAGKAFGAVKNAFGFGTKAADTAGKIALREGDALLAVIKDGKIIAQSGDMLLSHEVFVARTIGKLPEGAEVVTIGKSGGQIGAMTSKTMMGQQVPASPAAQAASQAAFK